MSGTPLFNKTNANKVLSFPQLQRETPHLRTEMDFPAKKLQKTGIMEKNRKVTCLIYPSIHQLHTYIHRYIDT